MLLNIKCTLLDDDLHSLEYLKMLCNQLPGITVVKCFNHPSQLLEALPRLAFDVCLLDIDMPSLNGLQVAELLPNKAIIFTTAHSQYAADAFDLNAIDFIRKPIQRNRLEKAFQKVREKLQNRGEEPAFYTFNTDKGKTLIKLMDLFYITTSPTEKRDKMAYLSNGQLYVLKNITLERLLLMLPADFFQINKGDLVALQAIHHISHNELTLKLAGPNNKPLQVPLSKTYRALLLQALGA